MRMDSFKDIAKYCTERFKNSLDEESERYVGTLYVSIDEHDFADCSTTPHILSQATKCILIHSRQALAITRWYTWYKVEYIDEEGSVTDGMLGNGFRLYSTNRGSFLDQVLILYHDDLEIYSCPAPFEDKMQKVWNVYLRAKRANSQAALELMAELIEKDETILELESEIANLRFTNILLERQKNQYRGLLRQIREMVDELKK